MHRPITRVIWALVLSSAVVSQAKIEDWSGTQGNSFTAETAGAYGPLAILRATSGTFTSSLVDRVLKRSTDKLGKPDLDSQPEPLLIITFYVDNAERKTWDVITDPVPFFKKSFGSSRDRSKVSSTASTTTRTSSTIWQST